MATTLACPCGRRLNVKGRPPGQRGRCPACGGEVRVPDRPAAPIVEEDEWNWEGTYGLEEPAPAPVVVPSLDGEPAGEVVTDFDEGVARPIVSPRPSTLAKEEDEESPQPEPWFPPRFLYPARGAEGLAVVASLGLALWVMGTLVPEYCLALMADAEQIGAPMMGHLVSVVTLLPFVFVAPPSAVYWLQYLARVLVASPEGERRPPRLPDHNMEGLFSGLGSWLTWLVLGPAVGALPLVGAHAAGYRGGWPVVGLGLVGLAYAVMALMLTFLHDDALAARPWRVVAGLARVGPSFAVLSLVTAGTLGMGAGAYLAALKLRAGHFWLYVVAGLACWMLVVWLTIVAMHALGAYYFARKDRLRWKRPGPWWEVG